MTTTFATCDFCDTHKGSTDDTFRVLPPVFHDYGQRRKFHGQVVTVKCFEDNTHVKALLESPGDGAVRWSAATSARQPRRTAGPVSWSTAACAMPPNWRCATWASARSR
jgi:hypothetical protein